MLASLVCFQFLEEGNREATDMFRPSLQAFQWCFLPRILGLVTPNLTEERRGQPEGLLAHTIDNNNPYDGVLPVKSGQG